MPTILIRLMPFALAWSFIAVYRVIAFALPTVIKITEPYDTLTSLRWAVNVPYFFKLAMAFLLNIFLRITGDSLIDPGKIAIEMTNWELIPVVLYFWITFSVLSTNIATWGKSSGEAIQMISETVIVLAEPRCQDFLNWAKKGIYRSLTWTLISVPLVRFLPAHLIAVVALSALSALVQIKFVAFIFFVLVLGCLTLWGNVFTHVPFPFLTYINMVYACRNDLLRLANIIKTERDFNAYIRNPYQYEIKE